MQQPSDFLGQSISADLYGCEALLLDDVATIERLMVDAARAANATVINVSFHHFSPFGVSGVVVIQESHVAIHTWPEFQFAALDVFTCGSQMNPQQIIEHLQHSLKAIRAEVTPSARGKFRHLARPTAPNTADTADTKSAQVEPSYTRDLWLTERQRNVAISLRHEGAPLFRAQSPVQKIEVFDTAAFGRALVLDGTIVCTEGDERSYHELLVHPALCTLTAPTAQGPHSLQSTNTEPLRALVLGGGDGAIAREITAHSSVASVTVVEIDPVVVTAVQQTIPSLARGLSDPRVTLFYDDAVTFVTNKHREVLRLRNARADLRAYSFDLIVVDAIHSAKTRITETLYQSLSELCAPGGVMVVPGGLLRADPAGVRETQAMLRTVFGSANVHPFCVHVPTMATGTWVGFWVSTRHPTDGLTHKATIDFSHALSDRLKLACYTAESHMSAFALPPWVRELLRA